MKLKIYGTYSQGFSGSGESDEDDICRTHCCPFCNSPDVVVQNIHTPSYWAECNDCGAKGPDVPAPRRIAYKDQRSVERQHRKAFEKALKAWNTRHH